MQNINTYSTHRRFSKRSFKHSRQAGFTLVEVMMVAVGIILLTGAILSFGPYALRKFRIASTVSAFAHAKTLASEYLSKESAFGRLPLTEGTNIPGNSTVVTDQSALAKAARFEDVLIGEGLLEASLKFPIVKYTPPTGTHVTWDPVNTQFTGTATPTIDYSASPRLEVRVSSGTNAVPSTSAGASFRLDGSNALGAAKRVLYAVLPGVSLHDAHELSKSLDGQELSETDITSSDDRGRVVYAYSSTSDLTDVYVYVAAY